MSGRSPHQFERRDRLIGVLGWRLARAFMDDQEARVCWHGMAGLLPEPDDPEAGLLLRGRLALEELARASDHEAETVSRAHNHERALLAGLRAGKRVPRPSAASAEDAAAALLCGLRTAVYRRHDPLPLARALELLGRELRGDAGSSPVV